MLASTLVTAFLAVTLFVFAKDPRTLRHHCTGTEDPKVQFFEKEEFCRFCFPFKASSSFDGFANRDVFAVVENIYLKSRGKAVA